MTGRFDDLIITHWGARFQGQRFPCAIGRSGIAQKTGEGDGISPKGVWKISQVAYRPDRLHLNLSNIKTRTIGPGDIWSDDPKDPLYNQWVKSNSHRFSHEALRRPDPLYDCFAILTYNWPDPTPGAGSAIFLHIWRKPRHPTEGCIAFSKLDFLSILANWTETSRVIIK